MIHCPASNFPVVDAANPAGCTDFNGVTLIHDQRGPGYFHDRHYAARCDIGAAEVNIDL
jgi:hypothetical protein